MPQDGDHINVVIHKRTKKANKSFMTTGEYVFFKYNDFLKIVKLLKDNGLL